MAGFSAVPSNFEFLKKLRTSKTASLKPCPFLKESTKLRSYQAVGAVHLISLSRMILADGAGLGKCVSGDTRIESNRGLIRIRELFGDNLKEDSLFESPEGFSVQSDKKVCSVGALYYSGNKKGLRIRTHMGYELEGLSHHPILVLTKDGFEYKKLEEITKEDAVCINRKYMFPDKYIPLNFLEGSYSSSNSFKYPTVLNADLAELLGWVVAEGHSPRKWTLVITQIEKETSDRIRLLLHSIFGYKESGTRKNYKKEITVNSVNICNFLKYVGLDINNKSADKRTPEFVFRSPKEVIRSYLRGYFEGDGSVSSGIVSCSSKSLGLLKEIQQLLLLFGIISRLKRKLIKVKGIYKPYWELYLCGTSLRKFKEEIGFISNRKSKTLEEYYIKKCNTNIDIFPVCISPMIKRVVQDITAYLKKLPGQNVKGGGWKGIVGEKYKDIIEDYTYGHRRMSYESMTKFINTIEANKFGHISPSFLLLKEILNRGYFYDKIVEKVECINDFYDLHVPEDHSFVGNGFVNHNTLQLISAYCYVLMKCPDMKLLIATPKSAVEQWAEEFEKFTTDIKVHVVANKYGQVTGHPDKYGPIELLQKHGIPHTVLEGIEARKIQYERVKAQVMVCSYYNVQQDYLFLINNRSPRFMLVFDEIQALKNRKSITHTGAEEIAKHAERIYGLSATIIKNRLEEAYNIYRIVVPGLFGGVAKFNANFIKNKKLKTKRGGKNCFFNKIIGYKNLDLFRTTIEPYFLIRRTKDVASELPSLISKKLTLDLTDAQLKLYREALNGTIYRERSRVLYYEFRDKIDKMTDPTQEDLEKLELYRARYDESFTEAGMIKNKLTALSYCQMISNGPQWLDPDEKGESSKEIEFQRLFEEEFGTEKVIVFTRFKSGIHRLEKILDKIGVGHRKITGDVSSADRTKARQDFQDMNQNVNAIFITQAGSAALNLQSANIILFYDTPWSYGDLYQTIGRAQRIGSIHPNVHVIHMVNHKTIDEHVLKILEGKKQLISDVMGDIAEGAIDFRGKDQVLFTEDEGSIDALFHSVFANKAAA